MSNPTIGIVGGGAAGFFAAIQCAEARPEAQVLLWERGPQFLSKVRISGGGRCNVTHACPDPRELSRFYPRGGAALLGPFHSFGPNETIEWFAQRGVQLKTEPDGRMFPVTDSSQTIIDCLLQAASAAGVRCALNCGVRRICRQPNGNFQLTLSSGETRFCQRVMLATGGCRTADAGSLAAELGHPLEAPVPSLFTFELQLPWLRALAGVVADPVAVAVPELGLKAQGPLLVTHQGLSGPAILRLSALGARALHEKNYQFSLLIDWLPALHADTLGQELQKRRNAQPARLVVNSPLAPLTARLWESLVLAAGISRETRWAALSSAAQHRLVEQLTRTQLPVTGKSLNKEEFVTCGGVCLHDVNFKTMESRLCPGLHFGGELLDIDGLTGGFNFQAAWTTGFLAGQAMSQA